MTVLPVCLGALLLTSGLADPPAGEGPPLPPAPASSPDAAAPADDPGPPPAARDGEAETLPESPAPADEAPPAALALDRCLNPASPDLDVRGCLRAVQQDYPGTLEANQAGTALRVLDVAQPRSTLAPSLMPSFLKPGYLELATVSGVYGVWAGVTGGILAMTNADQYMLRVDPWAIILGTGVSAVALGVAGAGAGYVVADQVHIDRGYAWSFTAGMTWGLSYAISTLPAVYDLVNVPWYIEDELTFGLPLLGGGLGALTGFGLAHLVRPDIAEVSMMNTGGWIGGVAGLIVGIDIATWGPRNLKVGLLNASTYGLGKSIGLLAGAGASQLLGYTWGETLLGDFGAVLGIILFGATSVAYLTSPVAEPWLYAVLGTKDEELFGKMATTTVSVAVAAGMGAGLLTTTAGLLVWHELTGAPVMRTDTLPVDVAPAVSFVPSRDGRDLAPVYGVAATW